MTSGRRPSYTTVESYKFNILLAEVKERLSHVVRLCQVWIPVKLVEISEAIESSAEDLSETSAASGGDDVGRATTRAVCINSSPRYTGARGTSRPTGPAWMETSRHFNVKRAGEEPRLPWDLSEEVVLSCMTTPHFCNSEAIKKMHDISCDYTFEWGEGILGQVWKWGMVQLVQDIHAMPTTMYQRHKSGRVGAARECVLIPVFCPAGEGAYTFVGILELFLGGAWSATVPGSYNSEMNHVPSILSHVSRSLEDLGLSMSCPPPPAVRPRPVALAVPPTTPGRRDPASATTPRSPSRDEMKKRARMAGQQPPPPPIVLDAGGGGAGGDGEGGLGGPQTPPAEPFSYELVGSPVCSDGGDCTSDRADTTARGSEREVRRSSRDEDGEREEREESRPDTSGARTMSKLGIDRLTIDPEAQEAECGGSAGMERKMSFRGGLDGLIATAPAGFAFGVPEQLLLM
mmetsp:Transcript_19469/g.61978  ORF Transcript_19469/g.61978 Transcript_19469/m.61978 type:complete len:460 (+) Transcript_19469:226-1605(+)|eukprot:CAMPEP_0182899532 /NCGR_PEP_ID=MMETSP0034_2-20130328/28124_1 /TAXON_ID=156128 /ORGANISM="Nephroselmis pyriformis, Strain CCMP717" /LENGTH=459 /DNA_ID=CAMNT_0025033567 /DNA_START=221 /DNA_END=1600 /DNA_ORIENTATION=+